MGAALNISKQRLAETILGAVLGAAFPTHLGETVPFFRLAATLIYEIISALLLLNPSADRYAGIILAIIMLPARAGSAWRIASYQISVEIIAGLLLTALWPDSQPISN